MIIFKEWGWLGNQIFQYCALRSVMGQREILILSGFTQLDELFDHVDAVFVNKHSPRIKRSLLKRWVRFIEKASEKNIVSTWEEDKNQILHKTNALIPQIAYIHKAFFQYEGSFATEVFSSLKIKENYLLQAALILKEKIPKGRDPFFIHLRRGDYLTWPTKTSPAVLPDSYYLQCMQAIRTRHPRAVFMIMTDDKDYAKKLMKKYDDVYVSDEHYTIDFALMSMCKGGILSASTFSWWCAFQIYQRDPDATLFAPQYWVGHRKNVWYPKNMNFSFLEYVEVPQSIG